MIIVPKYLEINIFWITIPFRTRIFLKGIKFGESLENPVFSSSKFYLIGIRVLDSNYLSFEVISESSD